MDIIKQRIGDSCDLLCKIKEKAIQNPKIAAIAVGAISVAAHTYCYYAGLGVKDADMLSDN